MTADTDRVAAALARKNRFAVTAATRQGTGHPVNEDCHLAFPEAGLFVVADGLGGHLEGQLASRAVTSILERVVDPANPHAVRVDDAEKALLAINAALIREAQRVSTGQVIGTTVVALVLDQAVGTCLWAGDSRCYLAREGNLFLVTRDHATPREVDGRRSTVLTRAIGSGPDLQIDRVSFEIASGDVILLCSDGVTASLADGEIHAALELEGSDAETLVDKAVAAGSRDDVTGLVIWVGPGQPA